MRILVLNHICGLHGIFMKKTISKALEIRGAKTFDLICGGGFKRCDYIRFHPKFHPNGFHHKKIDEICRSRRQNYRILQGLGQTSIEINRFIDEGVVASLREWRKDKRFEDYKELSYDSLNLFEIVRPTVCRFFWSDVIDEDESNYKIIFDFIKESVLFIEAFKKIYEEIKPDVVLIFNAMLFIDRIAYELAKRYGVRVVTYESGLSSDTFRFDDQGIAVLSERAEREYERSRDKILSSKEREELRLFLHRRAKRENVKTKTIPRFHETKPEDVKIALNIPDDRKIVTLFTTVSWDTGQVTRRMVHKDIFSWIKQTIEIFSSESEYCLVIRIHPGEVAKGERFPVAERISSIETSGNVVVINPENLIDSYTLMDVSNFGIVSVSTAGLEMVLRGRPVVCVGRAHYSRKGFTYDAESEEDYARLVKKLMKNPVITDEMVLKAERYAYFFFCQWSIPYPKIFKPFAFFEEGKENESYVNLILPKETDFMPGRDKNLDRICDLIMGRNYE